MDMSIPFFSFAGCEILAVGKREHALIPAISSCIRRLPYSIPMGMATMRHQTSCF